MKEVRVFSDNNIMSRYSAGILAGLILLLVNGKSFIVGNVMDIPRNLSTPLSGEEAVLPDNVRFVLAFARENQLTTLSISPALSHNRFIAQPLTESLTPTVIVSFAPIIVSYVSEALSENCTTIQEGKGLRIARCR